MYVSTLVQDEYIAVDTLSGDGEFVIRVPIGYDDETDAVYSLLVAFSGLAGYADVPGYELTFSLLEAQPDGNINEVWDGAASKRFLSDPEHRLAVKSLLHQAIISLIEDAGANLVHMTTHTPNLPAQALQKFNEICILFQEHGFISGRGDPWHGQHIWMMYREDAPATA